MAVRKTRFQTYRDEVQGQDDGGNDIIVSVPDKVVTEPPVGVRFTVLEARPDQAPAGGHYDGPPANLNLTVYEQALSRDSSG